MPLKRPLPPDIETLARQAEKLGLSCPEGRAIAATSRWKNSNRSKTRPEAMRAMKQATAEKWLAHWEKGGAIRTLGKTEEEYQRHRKAQAERYKAEREARLSEADRLRLEIRRARRRK